MFGPVRRCPASLPRTIRPLTVSARSLRVSFLPEVASGKCRPSAYKSLSAVRGFHQTTQWRQTATAQVAAEGEEELITRFSQMEEKGLVHKNVVKALREMKFDDMTEVQTMTINQAVQGNDIIAQAKTGTGKTLAFLIPILQRIINTDPDLGDMGRFRTTASDIRALIISPTRELAEQIANEARKLVRHTNVVVQTAVGGSSKSRDLQIMQRQGCHILVGTPGRLKDVFSDESTGVQAPKLDALVLDEADRLMDQGFWPEIEYIQELLPDTRTKDRQTLMFSATVPKEVVHIVRRTLKPGFDFVQTVDENDVPTHERVKQYFVRARGLENMMPALLELCKREIQKAEAKEARPFKAIVYFKSTAETKLANQIFREMRRDLFPARTFEIHSRLSQSQRTNAADFFRSSKSGILFSSDVTARGMDFPDVTHVIQIGLPQQNETYIHRLGRTARAGKEGEGWLFLADNLEDPRDLRRRIGRLPIEEDKSLKAASVDMSEPSSMDVQTAGNLNAVNRAAKYVNPETLSDTYRALFGCYQGVGHKQALVDSMNELAKYGWGLSKPPAIASSLVQRLGLGRVQGLVISEGRPRSEFGGRGDGPRGGFGRNESGRGGFGRSDSGRGGFGRSDSGRGGFGRSDSGRGGFGRSDRRRGTSDMPSSERKGVFRGGF